MTCLQFPGRPGSAVAFVTGHTGDIMSEAPPCRAHCAESPQEPLSVRFPGATSRSPSHACGARRWWPGHGCRVTSGPLPGTACVLITWWLHGLCSVGPERRTDTPVGKGVGSGAPPPRPVSARWSKHNAPSSPGRLTFKSSSLFVPVALYLSPL